MRHFTWVALLSFGLASAGVWACCVPPPGTCGDYGTAITFADDPKAAAKEAEKQQKLVFVLHVSGHFEDPSIT